MSIDFLPSWVVPTPGEQLVKLVPADPDHAMMYGSAVAITADGTKVVVGAWGDGRDEGMGYAGSLYVINGTTGTLLFKARPTGIGYDDRFASSVAITPDGTRIVAGAVHDDDNGQESGSAYILDGNTGATLIKVTAADGAQNDHFGGAVAISSDGTRIAVGAPEHAGSRGKAYVFGVDGTTITTLLKVTDDNWVTYFGKSAAMNSDGTRVVFGSGSGSVYIVEVATGTMTKVGVGTDRQAVAITPDGSRIVVGNDRDGTLGHLAGGAVVLDGNDGSVLHHLTAADGSSNDRFGYAVAISSDGARVAVSANYDHSGSAYMFDGTDGTQLLKVVGADSEWYDFFGSALAISSDGTRIVVGAENGGQHSPYTSDRSVGSAYIFQGPEAQPTPAASATGDPHLQNIHGERFDLMRSGNVVLIQIPRGQPSEKSWLTVEADARRLGAQCADMYFQSLNITGAWADKVRAGGLTFTAGGSRDETLEAAQGWTRFGPLKLKVVHGRTSEGIAYLNFYVKHLREAGAAVGGLLGEDDYTEAATPEKGCRKSMSLDKKAISYSDVGRTEAIASLA